MILDRKEEGLVVLQRQFTRFAFIKQFQEEHDQDALGYLLSHMTLERFTAPQLIFEKGELGNKAYIILDGRVAFFVADNSKSQDIQAQPRTSRRHSNSYDFAKDVLQFKTNRQLEQKLRGLKRTHDIGYGRIFGEMALVESPMRTYTALAEQNIIVAVISRTDYQEALRVAERKKQIRNMNSITDNPYLSILPRRLLNVLLFSFQQFNYKFRDIVYNQGDTDSDLLYIIKSGQFSLSKSYIQEEHKTISQIALLQQNTLFGDQEAFLNIDRQHTVQCVTDSGLVIGISLKLLTSKVSPELMELLRKSCMVKNKWHEQFLQEIKNTKLKFIPRPRTQSVNYQTISNMQQNQYMQKASPKSIPAVGPFLTNLEDSRDSFPKISIQSVIKSRQKSVQSNPEELVKQKLHIISQIHKLPEDQPINLQTFQQETIYVDKPKYLNGITNLQKWPIQVNLYLNQTDTSKSPKQIDIIHYLPSKMTILQRILQNGKKPRNSKRKKRELQDSYRKYRESQSVD